jgi:GH43 family beta-xylosidase
MKRILMLATIAIMSVANLLAQEKTLTLKDINIRDPYIMPVEKEGVYYMYASSPTRENGKVYGGMVAYKSKDLKTWEGPVRVFDVPRDNWITGTVWAPEVHKYKRKYYLFATLNSDIKWKGDKQGHPAYTHRATQVFWAKSPEGPFLPFDEKTPFTPLDEMALDGTLWVENGVPYMVYCHEWVETLDGEMNLVQLKKDLSGTVGAPIRLFCASAAKWSTGSNRADGSKTYVTDGCFLYRSKSGKLLMMWSSFMNGTYAVGIAESTTGKIIGPWRQQEEPIFVNGGHSMLFRTFDGRLCLVLHSPNHPGGAERAKIFELEDLGHTSRLKGELK